jgi:hypothetical protein
MEEKITKLARIAVTIKTPMALSGLVMIVLYTLYRQVLNLNVFSNIGGSHTFVVIQSVLDKLFWLALVALVLGVASYITTAIMRNRDGRLTSNVKLLDASLDPTRSPYEQTTEQDHRRKKSESPQSRQGT